MSQRGQAILMVILILGTIMAGVVIFGSKRQSDSGKLIERLDTSQAAQEVLSAAGKRVQTIYANESSCDPDVLDRRLSNMSNLPSNAVTAFGANMSYAVAQPSLAGVAARAGLCSGGVPAGRGCRQFGIPLEGRVYLVTAGLVATGAPDAARAGGDCPRDASIRLSVTIGGNLFYQMFTLINICTYDSCGTTLDDFTGVTGYSSGTFTDPCTGANANILARWHGSIVSPSPSTNVVTLDDIRWARRYLETGGANIGETTFMAGMAGVASGNGACSPANSNNQCVYRHCIPAFDLNRDRTNNEVDLAILESFLRGYLPSLSPNELDPRY